MAPRAGLTASWQGRNGKGKEQGAIQGPGVAGAGDCGVRGIVERQSTRDNRGTARLVNLTLDFIRLLRHSETPIEGIAALCGYEDASFLKVLFRRTYGISMRDYRRSKSR